MQRRDECLVELDLAEGNRIRTYLQVGAQSVAANTKLRVVWASKQGSCNRRRIKRVFPRIKVLYLEERLLRSPYLTIDHYLRRYNQ